MKPENIQFTGIPYVCVLSSLTLSSDAQVHHPPDPQRYLSDSEVELKQCQESFTRESEIRWAWGKLPQVSHHHCINLRKQLTFDDAAIVFTVK